MTVPVKLSRRGTVGILIGAIGVLFVSAGMRPDDPFGIELSRLLPRRRSARAVGKAYLSSAARDRSTVAALRQSLTNLHTAENIAQQVRSDFAIGNTVTVDGWVLSSTEAEACALLALS